MAGPSDMCTTCDDCQDTIDHPVSVHAPVGGGGRSPLDFCPECASNHMQQMMDRLGPEHGSKKVIEVKSKSAKTMKSSGRTDDEGKKRTFE